MTESTAVDLAYPVRDPDGGNVARLTLRRPIVSDMLAVARESLTPAEQEVALVAKLTGLPASVIERLDMADYGEVQKVVVGFQRPAPAKPAAPSSFSPALPAGGGKKSSD